MHINRSFAFAAPLLVSLLLCLCHGSAFADPTFRLTDMGILSGYFDSVGTDINTFGQAVGNAASNTNLPVHSFTFQNEVRTDIGTLNGLPVQTQRFAINDSGYVVGTSNNLAFLYKGGAPQSLGTLGGARSNAWDINNASTVVGGAELGGPAGTFHAFVYDTAMHDLGTFSTFSPNLQGSSVANGINNSGQVVGYSFGGVGFYHAFLHSGTGPLSNADDLGALPGSVSYDNSYASAINSVGQVVGAGTVSGTAFEHAFRWDPTTPNGSTGTMIDLGTPVGFTTSRAQDINTSGQIIGELGAANLFTTPPFLYDNGQYFDLTDNVSGWAITSVRGINDSGQIVGTAIAGGGIKHAVILTPITPEPGLLAMSGALMAAILWGGLRKRSRKLLALRVRR